MNKVMVRRKISRALRQHAGADNGFTSCKFIERGLSIVAPINTVCIISFCAEIRSRTSPVASTGVLALSRRC